MNKTSLKWSIKKKLVLIILGIVLVTLLSSSLVQLALGISYSKEDLKNEMIVTAHIAGSQSAAAIEFLDQASAEEILTSLAVNPSIQISCLYDDNGILFAFKSSNALGKKIISCPDTAPGRQAIFTSNALMVSEPIEQGRRHIGTMHIQSNLDEITSFTKQHIYISLIIIFLTLLISLALSLRLQRIISRPILHLLQMTEAFTLKQDYTIRAKSTSHDEVGSLVSAFNDMLDKIQERDMQLQQSVEEAVIAKRAAETASRMKSEFLSNMSHELRTPLNSLLILAGILLKNKEGNLNQEQINDMNVISSCGKDLLQLINELLDLAKIEAGKMELVKEEFSLHDLVTDIQSTFEKMSKEKGIGFDIHLSPALPETIYSDQIRIKQMIRNLLSNAFKFTEQGNITVDIFKAGHAGKYYNKITNPHEVIGISVKDTGIGIPQDKLQLIFETFQQVDGSISRQYGGSGLGLSICQQICNLLGGEVHVESDEGDGSTFTIYMPIENNNQQYAPHEQDESAELHNEVHNNEPENTNFIPASPVEDAHLETPTPHEEASEVTTPSSSSNDDLPAYNRYNFAGKTALIVDDDTRNIYSLAKILESINVDVSIATNGQEALDALHNTPKIDIVLMDIMMPIMGGYQAIKEIRKENRFAHLPIIAVTAKAMKEDKEECIRVGANEYISKPVDVSKLCEHIENYCNKENGTAA
jgi:two-component system chemotaxis sensor kinase CheA